MKPAKKTLKYVEFETEIESVNSQFTGSYLDVRSLEDDSKWVRLTKSEARILDDGDFAIIVKSAKESR